MNDMPQTSRDKLVSDLKLVLADFEELFRMTKGQAGDRMAEFRARLQDNLANARVRFADAETVLMDRTRAAARVTDDYVHDNPWKSIGIAAFSGLFIGLLIGRR